MIFILPFITPGLNGPDGLMRQHFHKTKPLKDKLTALILSQRPRGHCVITAPCRVTYIRHTSTLMDWDNACASFKHIGDALVAAKIIVDDNPTVLAEFIPKQIKCKRKEHKTQIIIEVL